MLEETLFSTLSPLFDGRVYPNVAPEAEKPYCTYAQIGGPGINYMESVGSDKKWARMQINVWSKTYFEAKQLIIQVEDALRGLNGYVEGAAQSMYDDVLKLHGFMQDFSFLT